MNKVITINLGGNAYQLEEAGYDALRAYLESAAARLSGNPDRDEILSDIEGAIAEKFRALLGARKTVVETREVAAVLKEMGPIEAEPGDASDSAASPAAAAGSSSTGAGTGAGTKSADFTAGHHGTGRRLYRIHEGAMLAGVCNGIAAYVNIDPTLIRIAFVLLTIFWGAGLLLYIAMAFIVPEAVSPEQKAEASGFPSTAQEFIRRAKEGYYEGLKHFPDKKARREWQRRFKRDMRMHANQWRYQWQNYWAERTGAHPGMGFALPFLSLLQGAVTVLMFCVLISLLAGGAFLGHPLPASLPVWAAVLLLLLVYGVVSGPIKLARRSCQWGMGRPAWSWSVIYLLDALIWIGVLFALFCLAVHYMPELQNAIHGLPQTIHQAVDDIRNWWNSK
jgi:phage shock protein PspC (stress-responsive transcriptional regulator)